MCSVARYERAAVAVLFYGSCLRSPEAELADNLLDFYVLVDDYRAAYDKPWLAVANRILPPNAFYCETVWQGTHIRAKYVVISLEISRASAGTETQNVSVWARYAQPARIVWTRDARDRRPCRNGLCGCGAHDAAAGPGPLEPTQPRCPHALDPRACARPMPRSCAPKAPTARSRSSEADQARYERLTPCVLDELGQPEMSPEKAAAGGAPPPRSARPSTCCASSKASSPSTAGSTTRCGRSAPFRQDRAGHRLAAPPPAAGRAGLGVAALSDGCVPLATRPPACSGPTGCG